MQNLREQVATGCRILAQQGLVHEIAGHVSARIPGTERMFVRGRSAAERGLRYTTTDAIRTCGFRGEDHAAEGFELPLELPIHGETYRLRDDVNAVVHAHPTYSVLCSVAGLPLEPAYGGYDSGGLRLALRGVPTYPHSRLVDDVESAHELVAAMADRAACLMRGHGVTVVGRDVPEAVMNALRLERLARFTWQLRLAGVRAEPVSDADQAFFTRPYKRAMGADTNVATGRERGADTDWRWVSYVAEDAAHRRMELGES
ncbi:class II aldolase/adducin family protein [Jiangella asiatica]|uniref:Class II aldolase/adducin family protein n=1 Tax=Jiangella asiatica TaxID=2530372 RepID=A0A4R5CK63_9ACTN|nr:class II aldolase/adducin family protein [Jiangella asiatica]TDE00689.1 class II aldolase/adducin family protein [Jiangella asiatica]